MYPVSFVTHLSVGQKAERGTDKSAKPSYHSHGPVPFVSRR